MSESERFWSLVKKAPLDACWEWQGGRRNGGGYGGFGKSELAHRAAWRLTYGPVPSGMFVCHVCDNPKCVRPSHLFLGSAKDNRHDCVKKGRHGKHAALLSVADVVEIKKELAGGVGLRELGRRFGVRHTTIRKIRLGLTWRHV